MHSSSPSYLIVGTWPLTMCVAGLASTLGCHSDRLAGERPSDVVAAAVPPPNEPPPKTLVFIWGVNGHPGVQAAYEGSGPQLTEQLNYLNTLRARYYRIDVRTDPNGNVTLPTTFTGILDAAAARGVKILPVIDASPNFALSQGSNYSLGFTIGRNFASRYRGRFTHIEAGNELAELSIVSGEGRLIDDYDDGRLRQTTSFLRGMAEGIHSGAPGTGVIIDEAFLHYGFFKALDRDGVPYDVYGWHWYSDFEDHGTFGADVLPNLTNVNKEIWLTEVNRGNQEGAPNDPIDQANKIARYVREFHAMPRVKALFIYELFEEKVWLNPPGQAPNPPQAYFGIVGCPDTDIGCTNRTLKPGFNAYRYGIEERLFGFEDYVYSLYVHLNRRTPDASGLAFWTNRFKAAPNDTLGLINAFIPEESYKVFIDDQFRALLDRPAPPDGIAYWNDRMRNGHTRYQVIVDFCVSPEFWTKSGSTNAGFVDRLYLKLWQKSSSTDPGGRWYYINQLNSGVPKWDVAGAFLNASAYRSLFVKEQFLALLDRDATGSEVNTYVNKMFGGSSQEAVIRMLLRLREYADSAVRAGYDRRQ